MRAPGGLALLLLAALAPAAQSSPAPIIHRISIEGNVRTRTHVIRRELLFAEGDSLDLELVAETERNLRRLLYLGRVSTRVEQQGERAEVHLRVRDVYARALSPLLSGESNELSFGAVALDYNLFGRGQTARLEARHRAVSGNSLTLFFAEPRLFDSRQALAARLGAAAEGHDLQLTLSRPLYALSTHWAYGASVFSRERIQRLYAGQELSARYTDRLDGGSLWLTRSYGGRLKIRPNFRLSFSDRRFDPTRHFAFAPEDRRRLVPSLGLTLWRPRYEKTRFLHLLGRTEDVQTGPWLSLRTGLSQRALGSDLNFPFFQAQLAPRFKPYGGAYTFITLFLSSRIRHGGRSNLVASAQLLTYAHIHRIHTLALRLRFDALSRPEDDAQLLLGIDRGLRGYAPRRFDGRRRLLFNLEARPTFYRRRAFTLAGAFFADGGDAWTPGLSSPAPNLALGFGGRVGLPQVYNTPVLRADLAYALKDRVWQLSFGVGQFF